MGISGTACLYRWVGNWVIYYISVNFDVPHLRARISGVGGIGNREDMKSKIK